MHPGGIQFRVLGVLVIGAICSVIACTGRTASGANNGPNTPSQVAVQVTPSATEVTTGLSLSVVAKVSGTTNTALVWTVDDIPGGNTSVGSIQGSGGTVTYAAPSVGGRHTIAATSAADASARGAAIITVQSGLAQAGCAPSPSSSLSANVRDAAYGAKGDGVTDDTAAIQRAVDAVAGTGGTVTVPDGTYMVNVLASGSTGIRLGNNMTFSMAPGAVLKAIPNSSGTYAILAVRSVNRVNIKGGTLLGERNAHTGSGGEWGMGLSISQSDQVVVEGVTARECWGDGFYITDQSTNVTLCNVTAEHNRRQGLSVTSVDGLVVRNSTFKNTTGTEPECGIDIEPNNAQTVNHVLITGCTLTNNAGGGFQCGFNSAFTSSRVLNTVFDQNTVADNGVNAVNGNYKQGVKVSHSLGNVSITNNVITNSLGQGIMVMEYSANTIVSGNTVTGTRLFNGNTTWTGGGIYISQSPNSSVTNNTVTGNQGLGIWNCSNDLTVVISGNTLSGNGRNP